MRMLTLAAIMMLVGCASVGDLEKKAPDFNWHTAKSADAYKRCVVQEWTSVWSTVHAEDTDYGFKVIVPDPVAETDVVLLIKRTDSGADVSFHKRSAYLGGGQLKDAAKACI